MPFGIKNMGVAYQRNMIDMFHDLMHTKIETYVDEILVLKLGKI